MEKTVTLADIAERSGLSVSAVSLALRNKPGIPPETRERVLELADEMGYQRKLRKPTPPLGSGKIRNLAAVIKFDYGTTPQANAFYSHVLFGIEQACRQRHVNLLFASLPVDRENNPTELPRVLVENQADGLLLVGVHVGAQMAGVLGRRNVPVVLADGYADEGLASSVVYDSVVSDNVDGANQMVEHLVRKGHRQIAYATNAAVDYPSFEERREGYERALATHGLAPHWLSVPGNAQSDAPAAREQVAAFMAANPGVTAVLGCNDITALAVMRAAKGLGVRVPEELSVAGFDDVDEARTAVPALTTMAVDKVAMGWSAVMLLLERAERPESARMTLTLHTMLVERESVCERK